MSYRNNKRRKKEKNNGKFIVPVLLFVATLWIGISSHKGKSPTELISDIYLWAMGKEQAHPNRVTLHKTIEAKNQTIDSLQQVITTNKNKSPYRTAIVNTTANSLNLRSMPTLSSDVVIKIPDSSAVKILYFDEEVLVLDGASGKWCKIKYADKEGWVWGNYLKIIKE